MVKTRGKEYPGMETEGGNLQGVDSKLSRPGWVGSGGRARDWAAGASARLRGTTKIRQEDRDIWAVWSHNFPPPENNPFSESRFQMGNLNLKNKIVIFSNRKKIAKCGLEYSEKHSLSTSL